jgi:5'(3')-deoxyribonucleotidase
MRIGLDVDGTVYDWDSSFRTILKRLHGIELPVSAEWDSIEESITKEHWSSVWDSARIELFTGGSYYLGAQDTVRQLIERKHDVIFITATPVGARAQRANMLFRDFPGISGVCFVNPMHDDKSLVKCDLYVDDKPEVIATLLAQGHNAVLINRPWNKHVRSMMRIYTWEQLLAVVGA